MLTLFLHDTEKHKVVFEEEIYCIVQYTGALF